MQKKKPADTLLMTSIADSLLDALPIFPRQLLALDMLQRTHHMPLSHLQIMLMLKKRTMSVGDLSKQLGIAKPNITPLVDSLCERGFVQRVRSELDHRKVNVHLLSEGEEELARIRQSIIGHAESWSNVLSRSEMREMNNALASILRILEAVDNA